MVVEFALSVKTMTIIPGTSSRASISSAPIDDTLLQRAIAAFWEKLGHCDAGTWRRLVLVAGATKEMLQSLSWKISRAGF